jgi:hypothetical protein
MGLITSLPKNVAPGAFEAELVALDEGVQSTLPAGTALTINGVATKQAAIDTQLQSWITVFKAADAAKAAYQNAVAARVAITAAAKAYVKALKAVIKSYFGAQSVQLQAFGIKADKVASTSAQTKLVAAMKRQQTRAVRGTTGKKQKASLTVVGNPPVIVPSKGENTVIAPPVNVGNLGPNLTISAPSSSSAPSSTSSTPASTAAPATPAPAGSGSGSGTPSNGSGTPAAS